MECLAEGAKCLTVATKKVEMSKGGPTTRPVVEENGDNKLWQH
jgi:hypothetical protein